MCVRYADNRHRHRIRLQLARRIKRIWKDIAFHTFNSSRFWSMWRSAETGEQPAVRSMREVVKAFATANRKNSYDWGGQYRRDLKSFVNKSRPEVL